MLSRRLPASPMKPIVQLEMCMARRGHPLGRLMVLLTALWCRMPTPVRQRLRLPFVLRTLIRPLTCLVLLWFRLLGATAPASETLLSVLPQLTPLMENTDGSTLRELTLPLGPVFGVHGAFPPRWDGKELAPPLHLMPEATARTDRAGMVLWQMGRCPIRFTMAEIIYPVTLLV